MVIKKKSTEKRPGLSTQHHGHNKNDDYITRIAFIIFDLVCYHRLFIIDNVAVMRCDRKREPAFESSMSDKLETTTSVTDPRQFAHAYHHCGYF